MRMRVRVSAKVAGICGITSPIIAFATIALSISLHPWFRWADNALSDLGAIGVHYNIIFNLGLILAGIFGLVFTLGLPWNIKRKMGLAGVVFFGAGIISLIMIGVFPEGTFLHRSVSIDFYMLGFIGMVTLGIDQLRGRSERVWGWFILSTLILAISAILLLTTIPYNFGAAIPETIGAIAFSEFSIGLGGRLIGLF